MLLFHQGGKGINAGCVTCAVKLCHKSDRPVEICYKTANTEETAATSSSGIGASVNHCSKHGQVSFHLAASGNALYNMLPTLITTINFTFLFLWKKRANACQIFAAATANLTILVCHHILHNLAAAKEGDM